MFAGGWDVDVAEWLVLQEVVLDGLLAALGQRERAMFFCDFWAVI